MISAFGVEHGEIEKSIVDTAYRNALARPARLKRLRAKADKPYKPYGSTLGDKVFERLHGDEVLSAPFRMMGKGR